MITGPSILTKKIWFPPAETADKEGLLAIGGDLSVERLLLAYRSGIFPWYDGPVPLWWNPDPRFVLFPEELYISRSMLQVMNREQFHFTRNQRFEEVISSCKSTERRGQDGTWITDDIRKAYIRLHELGYATSFEAWEGNELLGGLYGVVMGKIFFGESMFSRKSNASKAAFIWGVEQLKKEGILLIDCQVYTAHLESLGARFISRNEFLKILGEGIIDH